MSYTYFIKWSKLNLQYYGVKYEKGAGPEGFWNSYFTSSKKVLELKESVGDPDIIKIRETFSNAQDAIDWEAKVLRRLKVASKPEWLNMCDRPGLPQLFGNDNPMKNEQHKKTHLESVRTDEYRKKMSEIKTGYKHTEETKNKLRRPKYSNENYFGSKSDEHKENIKQAALKRPRVPCSKCGKGITKANLAKHEKSCE